MIAPESGKKMQKGQPMAIPAWHATAMTRTKAGDSAANTHDDWAWLSSDVSSQGVPKCQPLEGPGITGINTGIMYVL